MIAERAAAALRERRQAGPFNSLRDYRRVLGNEGGALTRSGITVSGYGSLVHGTVYGCVRVLSTVIGMLPMVLYQRTGEGEGDKRRAREHPLYPILAGRWNRYSTAFEAKRTVVTSVALLGNGPVFIERDQGGRIRGLHPFRWEQTELAWDGDQLVYRFRPAEGRPPQPFSESEVWHLRGASINGLEGLSVVGLMRETVGHGLGMKAYSQNVFGQDARPGLAVKVPGNPSDTTINRLREEWNSQHQGPGNSSKVRFLIGQEEVTPIEIPPKDSQWLEAQEFNVREICSIFGVDPAYVFAKEQPNRATAEERSREFRAVHLGPWLTNFEQAAERDLLTPREIREGYFIRFNADALLRTDPEKRATSYRTAIMSGYLTRNEVRELEDRPRLEGLDEPLAPQNMALVDPTTGEIIPIGGASVGGPTGGNQPTLNRRPPGEQRASVEDRARLAERFEPIFAAAAERIIRMEVRELRAALDRHLPADGRARKKAEEGRKARGLPPEQRDLSTLQAELERLYARGSPLADFTTRTWRPNVELLVDQALAAAEREAGQSLERRGLLEWIAAVVAAVSTRTLVAHRARAVGALLGDVNPRESLLADLELWKDLPGTVAHQEAVRVSRAAAREGFRRAGVERLVWVTRGGDTCPFCEGLEGRTVSLIRDEPFLPEGSEVPHKAGGAPLVIKARTMQPPLHLGCVCEVAPG